MGTRWLLSVMATVLFLASPAFLRAQAPYSGEVPMDRGQDVAPAFEGWIPNPDGTISMWFGYMNRNYKEQLDIPIVPDNNVDPGGDRGQPTHFYPRRQRMVSFARPSTSRGKAACRASRSASRPSQPH